MKILITGGNGYIAKSLYTKLSSSHDIICITRRDFDLTNYAQTTRWLADKYFDVVIHTAVVGGSRLKEEDEMIVNQNLDMYYNLMANKEHFGRFISFGSGAELGLPETPYGYSKRIIAESMLKRDYCLNIRIFAVFDENELDTRFIKGNLLRYINRESMVIHQNKYMDFFYMRDLVSLVDLYITERGPIVQEIDCCYDRKLTLLEIANFINTLDEYKVDIEVQSEGMGDDYTGQYCSILSTSTGLAQGIRETHNKLKTQYKNFNSNRL